MRNPEQRPNPEIHERRSMNEDETKSFLIEHEIESPDLQEWQPHEPILYVLEEFSRDHFRSMPPEARPSIARIDDASEIDLDDRDVDDNRVTYALHNAGGRVDYFAIDPTTKIPRLVRSTSQDTKKANFSYRIRQENFFHSYDELFPKGQD